MKVVRTIVYEGDDEKVKQQIERSLEDGVHDWKNGFTITITTDGPVKGTVRLDRKTTDE